MARRRHERGGRRESRSLARRLCPRLPFAVVDRGRRRMAALMLQGTGSDVGKSVPVPALCRALTNRGLRVLPFKPQNMSNNAAVTAHAGQIGRAQALQTMGSTAGQEARGVGNEWERPVRSGWGRIHKKK